MPEQERLDSQVRKTARRFAVLAFITAGFTYALILFGGIVPITGSGMGCGEDWPLCNGQIIPPMNFETLIEYGHRLAAVLVGFLVLALAVYSVRRRHTPGLAGRGISGLGVAAAALLIAELRTLTEAPAVRDTSMTYPRWALASSPTPSW
ncbi:MAG: hypothetical protein AMS25_01705 [Gemmatimonas sp. SM23_52]|nr:MAG: hypothetical protein AMS25_01705 [Gemmatimonas sp. SM23_52]